MIIELENVVPSPYRKIEKYPVDQDKVDRIKRSIEESGWWGGLHVRPSKKIEGKYELCFGQHRITALRELGYTEIEFTVNEYDDAEMFQLFLNENVEFHHERSVKVIHETVENAKRFLETSIEEAEGDWEKLHPIAKTAFDGETGYHNSVLSNKTAGPASSRFKVGREVLFRFLGGKLSDKQIRRALSFLHVSDPDKDTPDTLRPNGVDCREVAESFETQAQAQAFVEIMDTVEAKIAVDTEEAAQEIAEKVQLGFIERDERPSERRVKEETTKQVMHTLYKKEVPLYNKRILSSPMVKNRNYFQNMVTNFNKYTVSPDEIPHCTDFMAMVDYQYLMRAIKTLMEKAVEYEKEFDCFSTTMTRMYDVFDADNEEEWKITKAYLDANEAEYPKMTVEDWCLEEVTSICENLKTYIDGEKWQGEKRWKKSSQA